MKQKAPPPAPPPARNPGNTRVTISLPKGLLDRIDAAAAGDHRNRSSWIVKKLDDLLHAPALTAMEHRAQKHLNAG